MHFQHILLASAVVSCSLAAPTASTTSDCVATLLTPTPPNAHCNVTGLLTRADPLIVAYTSIFDDCASSCLSSKGCISFGYNESSSSCQEYGKTLIGQGFSNDASDTDIIYYAASCFGCSSSTATSSTTPSTATFATSTTSIATSTLAATSSATTPTATATSYPPCPESSVTVGQVIFDRYYIGAGYTHDDSSSSTTFPTVTDILYGWVPATEPCAAIDACAIFALAQSPAYASFAVQLVADSVATAVWNPVWECVAFEMDGSDVGAFDVGNSSIVEAYGFAVGT